MKKFKISLNPLDKNSIKAAISEIEKMQRINWFQEFVKASCEWIINRANMYLDAADLPAEIKNDIKSLWNPPIIGDKMAILSNGSDDYTRFKIDYETDINVLIEFGVGITGANNPHPMAKSQGKGADYKYDVQTRYKLGDRSWIFRVKDENYIDIMPDNMMTYAESNSGITIRTKGQRAVMYFHRAVMDYVNGGFQKVKI